MNITYKEKDQMLKVLCDNFTPETLFSVSRKEFDKAVGIPQESIYALFQYFMRIGIVSEADYRFHSPAVRFTLHVEALDIFNRGGFTFQEQMLQQEVEKLLLEIETLTPDFGDKLKRVTTIANNLAGIAGTFVAALK